MGYGNMEVFLTVQQRQKLIAAFAENDLPDSLFVLAGHFYELESLLQHIKSHDFEIITTMEFVNRCYPN